MIIGQDVLLNGDKLQLQSELAGDKKMWRLRSRTGILRAVQVGQSPTSAPLVSVIVLNYNGARWIEKCINSVFAQTLANVELIVVDNCSTDNSDVMAEKALSGKSNALFVRHSENLGYCEGNNRAARLSSAAFLLFLNNDAWLEADCLEKLCAEVQKEGAAAATPLVMNWDTDEVQWGAGASGFDPFGLPYFSGIKVETTDLMMPGGCSYFIRRDLFELFGGLDPVFFMYADEWDLSWKVWVSGHRAILVPSARAHHRGAVNVNPVGGEKVTQNRTSESKRYYSNRNCLITLAKNCQGPLLILIPFQIGLLCVEALVGLALIRRWTFIRRSYYEAIRDFVRLGPHIARERAKLRAFRKRGDFYMLRFLRLRLNRWDELRQVRKLGLPKVDAR